MAVGKKTGGKDFTPGNPGGPGRPPIPDDIKNARRLNRQEVERTVNLFLYMSEAEIDAKLQDKTTVMLEHLVGSIVLRAKRDGDPARMNFLIEQVLGSLPKNFNIRNYSELSDDAVQDKIKKLMDEFHKSAKDEETK